MKSLKKKSLLIILVIIICVFSDAAAESHNEFVFRNNITWEMNKEEVEKFEGLNNTIQNDQTGRFELVLYSNVPISRYLGNLIYVFEDDKLIATLYNLDNADEAKFIYLTKMLTEVYGEETNQDDYIAMEYLSPDYYYAVQNYAQTKEWTTADETKIILFWNPKIKKGNTTYPDAIDILYVSPNLYHYLYGTPNTTGL